MGRMKIIIPANEGILSLVQLRVRARTVAPEATHHMLGRPLSPWIPVVIRSEAPGPFLYGQELGKHISPWFIMRRRETVPLNSNAKEHI